MKKLTPKTATTFNKICKLETDWFSSKKAWIGLEAGKVIISNQEKGHASTGNITLSRKDFERFIKWYETGE